MKIDIITLFPEMFASVFKESIIKRAQVKRAVEICVHNLRDYSDKKSRNVDDRPFGGGAGMVMRVQPVFCAIESLKKKSQMKVIYLTPDGKKLTQVLVKKYAKCKHVILLCGHYEGIDQRIRDEIVDDEISIGDYILTGGELPAMVFVDSVVRLLPGVLGCADSNKYESFEDNLLECPHYTRPEVFRGMCVPKVLTSGNHAKIEKWRKEQAVKKTKKLRPDLLNLREGKIK